MTSKQIKELIAEANTYTRGTTIEVTAYLSGRLKYQHPDMSKILYTILEETREKQIEYEEDLVNKAIDTTLRMSNHEQCKIDKTC